MTEPRNEFDFEQWCASEGFEVPGGACDIARTAWHAALDALRAKLATKELWVSPMKADDEMLNAARIAPIPAVYLDSIRAMENLRLHAQWNAMRDSYIVYYGTDHESGL